MKSKTDSTYKNETLVLDMKLLKNFCTYHSIDDSSEKMFAYKKC